MKLNTLNKATLAIVKNIESIAILKTMVKDILINNSFGYNESLNNYLIDMALTEGDVKRSLTDAEHDICVSIVKERAYKSEEIHEDSIRVDYVDPVAQSVRMKYKCDKNDYEYDYEVSFSELVK